MPKGASFTTKFLLVLFGLAVGIAGSELVLRFIAASKAGSEFGSVADLQQTMLESLEEEKKVGETTELRSLLIPHPAEKIIYDLRPNLDLTFQNVRVTTNSCGMRDRESPLLKPSNTYRIALLGDSFAFGWGVDQDQIFAQVLEDNLNRLSWSDQKFEVLNFGIPGYSTFQEVEKFLEIGLDFDPDAVLIYFVSNDFGYPFYVRDVHQPGNILSAVRFAQLTWKAIDPQVEERRLFLTKLDPSTTIRRLNNLTRQHGMKLHIVFNPRSDWAQSYNRIPILRERRDIHVIELRRNFIRLFREMEIPEEDLVLPHDPHPSAIRHQMLGDLLTLHFMDVA